MRILESIRAAAYVRRLASRGNDVGAAEKCVRPIVEAVRRRGDRALFHYARRLDGWKPGTPIRVPQPELKKAWSDSTASLKTSLRNAAANIRQYCEYQKPIDWMRTRKGVSAGQIVVPLDSVGCYVPAGRHPLVSTLLMTVIPAQVAGVEQIRVVSPHPTSEMLAAAAMLGVTEFYRIGGAQAIAALAYGTQTVPRVDKIVGPGNSYVTAAKKMVSFDCSIDMLAGPTEVAVISDTGDPQFIAADLVAQAEHDPESLALFITTQPLLARQVATAVNVQSRSNQTARRSLRSRGAVLLARSRQQAFDWVNEIAPEHVTVDDADLHLVRNAGSVFVGKYSAQSVGDYASGPNHVLPTGGAARFRGGLSVLDFVKIIAVQKITASGLRQIAPVVTSLAELEGLPAHANSVRVRCAGA